MAIDYFRGNNMQNAKDTMNKARTTEDFLNTAVLFDAIDDPEAVKLAKRCRKLAALTRGSRITMGKWNGHDLEWDIVEEHGKQRMLVCRELIGEHAYMDLMTNSSWGTCSLRKWLNTEFLKEAFTNEERMQIMYAKVENPASAKWATEGGRNTSDRIFIMDINEIEKYYPDLSTRAMGKWWWVRTPGMNLQSVVAVYADGSMYDYGIRVNYTDGGVRPALWLMPRL